MITLLQSYLGQPHILFLNKYLSAQGLSKYFLVLDQSLPATDELALPRDRQVPRRAAKILGVVIVRYANGQVFLSTQPDCPA